MAKEIDTQILRKLLRYEPETGKLYWLERDDIRFNTQFSGREAFTAVGSHGYHASRVMGTQLLAHRLIWALVYGEWPKHEIDHINGQKTDNRLQNLRSVTASENGRNKRISRRSSSGVIGVYWAEHASKWRAEIKIHQKRYHLGYFPSKAQAASARKSAERSMGFHPNHGRCA